MRQIIILTAIAIIVLTSAAASASAQMTQKYRAEIPFDFSIGNRDMKAGSYTLGLFNSDSSAPVLGITSRASGVAKAIKPIILSGYDRDTKAVLKFVRSGDHYDLAEVVAPEFSTKLKKTWSDVRQVTKNAGGNSETVSIYIY
ncbi:MAG: hypothetical protein ABI791_07215 [Acidobacteriota bacterium]